MVDTSRRGAPSASLSPNAWRSVIEIDLYGTFFCSQAVMPVMKAQGGGRVVNVSMTLHYRGWPQMAHATAAKAGIEGLVRSAAITYARSRIRFNAVAPGLTETPLAAPLLRNDASRAVSEAMHPLGRLGTPEDVAIPMAYLLGP